MIVFLLSCSPFADCWELRSSFVAAFMLLILSIISQVHRQDRLSRYRFSNLYSTFNSYSHFHTSCRPFGLLYHPIYRDLNLS